MKKNQKRRSKTINKLMIAAVASLCSVGSASAAVLIVDNNNLDTVVANEGTTSSQTEGVKNGPGENNGGGTTIGPSDPGQEGYWQGFKTGSSGGYISLLSLDLAVLYSTPGVDEYVSGADTATFYLYSYPGAMITDGRQLADLGTVTAADIEGGALAGYNTKNGSDIYQYNLINSLSGIYLNANTAYAIVMMTSSGNQDVGWTESNTEATGDMGEFENVNAGGNNTGAFGQMELVVAVPETFSPLLTGLLCLGLAIAKQGQWLF